MRIWIAWMAVLLALAGCAKRSTGASDYGYYEDELAEMDSVSEGRVQFARAAREERPSRRPAAKRAAPPPQASGGMRPDEPADRVARDREPQAERMIVYEGSTTLRVARIRPAVDAITATVEALEGFVERVDGSRVVVRVPVARFEEGLAAVQAHGDVIDERIFASDVTEAFQDVQLRLDTARATRDRLLELLAQTEDEKEKLALLQEIQRLTDQIDQMTAQSTTLRRLADLSRIVVSLVEREALANQGAGEDSQAFAWIRRLSPFGSDIVRAGGFVNLDVPEGMVGLKLWREYVAEAPDGSRIWSGKLDTRVEAEATFWVEAVKERLGEDFASAEVDMLGEFGVVTFTSRDEAPYTWVVAIRPRGRHLEVVEAYLASPEAAERFLPAVRAVIGDRGGEA
jgi:hypothetical protein